MTDSKVISLNKPEQDPLNALLKQGAQQLLAKAIESELGNLVSRQESSESLICNYK